MAKRKNRRGEFRQGTVRGGGGSGRLVPPTPDWGSLNQPIFPGGPSLGGALENTFRGGLFDPPRGGGVRRSGGGRGSNPRAPLLPPPGTYDPALDAQLRASGRGLGDLEEDTLRAGGRADVDYEIGKGEITRQFGEGVQDLSRDFWRGKQGFADQRSDIERQSGRGLADLLTQRTRGGEDYRRATSDLALNFKRLGNQQTQNARAMGVASGGALVQGMRKRAENQGREQSVLDTANERFMSDSELAEQRLTEDRDLSLGRLGTAEGYLTSDAQTAAGRMKGAADRGQGMLTRDFVRGGEDRQTALDRARRENTQFGLDVGAQKWFGSRGLYQPPSGYRVNWNKVNRRTGRPQIVNTNKRRRNRG